MPRHRRLFARDRGDHKGSGEGNAARTEHREMAWVHRSENRQSGGPYHSGGPAQHAHVSVQSLTTQRAPTANPHLVTPGVQANQPRLLDRLREALRSRHYSRRTEQAYRPWVKRFIFFHSVRHPAEMAEPEINAFLTHLALKEKVSASTQTQALSALLFLYRHVLGREIGNLGEVIRAKKPKRPPVVLTREEVKAVLDHLQGDRRLMAALMYGTGLRLMECLC